MRQLVWETDAANQLDDILGYIAERNGPAAERLERIVTNSVDHLVAFPFMGRPGRIAGSRALIVHPNYIIIYQVTETWIDIIRVLHAHQQYP
jgi:toxin ParE1/3/4